MRIQRYSELHFAFRDSVDDLLLNMLASVIYKRVDLFP
jgi:hypothetical protein